MQIFFKTTREIRGLIQKAIARIRGQLYLFVKPAHTPTIPSSFFLALDLQIVADFLSNPAEKDKKAKEIQIIADVSEI